MNDPESESKNAASPPPLENRPAETERNGCILLSFLVVVALATLAMIFHDELGALLSILEFSLELVGAAFYWLNKWLTGDY
jgi:hypothetical protein